MHNFNRAKSASIAAFILSFICSSVSMADDIESRVARQQGKIGNKRSDKKLSAAQAARADNMSYKITSEEQEMKTKHQGKLTRRDKAKLNRQLNRNDRIINRQSRNNK